MSSFCKISTPVRVRKVNKTKFWTKFTIWWPINALTKLSFLFPTVNPGLDFLTSAWYQTKIQDFMLGQNQRPPHLMKKHWKNDLQIDSSVSKRCRVHTGTSLEWFNGCNYNHQFRERSILTTLGFLWQYGWKGNFHQVIEISNV